MLAYRPANNYMNFGL